MYGPGRRSGLAAVLVAALLVLQGFASAWAGGAMPLLDAFGNPICQDSRAEGSLPTGDHGLAVDCCTFACHGVGSALVPPASAELDAPARHRIALAGARLDAPPAPRPDHDPASPRAPPAPTI